MLTRCSPRRFTFWLLCAGATLPACSKKAEAPVNPPAAGAETVAHIDSVHCAILKSDPPQLVVTAYGNVPTGGWTGEQLEPRTYAAPPAGGIWDYDFTAVPPNGPATQVITPSSAAHTWLDYPATHLRGVRIHGKDAGVKESTLDACHE